MASFLSERAEYIKFWTDLTFSQRRFLNKVTEDMPLDRTAGLRNVHRKLWKGPGKAFGAFLLMLRLVLNTATAIHSFQEAFSHHSANIDESKIHGSLTEMTRNFLVVCESTFADHNGSDEHKTTCVKFHMDRLHAYRFVCAAEMVIVCTMSGICVLSFLCYTVCRNRNMPFKRPYFFFFLPKIASKTSAITPLQIMGIARLRSLFLNSEGMMWLTMLWTSLYPQKMLKREMKGHGALQKADQTPTIENLDYIHEEEVRSKLSRSWYWLGVVLSAIGCIVLVTFAIQALLVKLTLLHFASVVTWKNWSLKQWFVFFGLVNQLAGLCFVDEIEMHRLLLLKFGGVDSKWGRTSSMLCADYFALLAHKIDDGEVDGNLAKAYVMMCTMGSHDVQELLLSREREAQLDGVREERLQLLEEMYVFKGGGFEVSIEKILTQKADEIKRAQERLEEFRALPEAEKSAVAAAKLQCVWRARTQRLKIMNGEGVPGQKEVVEKMYEREQYVKEALGGTGGGGDKTRALLNDAVKTDNTENLTKDRSGFSLKAITEFMTIVKPRLDYLYHKRDEIVGDQKKHYLADDGGATATDVAARFAMAAILQEEAQDIERGSQTWFQGDYEQLKANAQPSFLSRFFSRVSLLLSKPSSKSLAGPKREQGSDYAPLARAAS